MPKEQCVPSQISSRGWRVAAAAVHFFTSLGVVCAFFAVLAAVERAWEHVFVWLGLALAIDGIDGIFARHVDVHRRLPRFSGERLDQVVDYVTYVFVPVLVLRQAGYLPGAWGVALAAAILLSSLFHFIDLKNKASDHSFVGFPAIWNIVAFYVLAIDAGPWLASTAILVCVGLTFVPLRWVHPLRVVALRPITALLTLCWVAAASFTLWQGFPAHGISQAVLVGIGICGIGLAVLLGRPRPLTGSE